MMASIRKIEGKTKVSYKITVYQGKDISGKQIRRYRTWSPERPMSPSRMEQEARKAAFAFEQELAMGYEADCKQSFAEYADYVIRLKVRQGAAPSSIELYRNLLEHISPIIGHLRLNAIRPQHLNTLYEQLCKPGSCKSLEVVKLKEGANLSALIAQTKKSKAEFAKDCGISYKLLRKLCNGEGVCRDRAQLVACFLGVGTDSLFELKNPKRPLAYNTIRRVHSFISSVFSQAEREMLIPFNPAHRASPPPSDQYEPDYFQPEQIGHILELLEDEPIKYRTIVHLLIVTGCRRGEIMGLKWEKIDFERKQVRIDTSLSYLPDRGIYEGATKTRNVRYIALPDETLDLLKAYQQWQNDQKAACGEAWQEMGYLFTRSDGRPMFPNGIQAWLTRFSKRHSLPHIHPHTFRHTAASILIANGVDVLTVSKMLGHATTTMTTNTYGHMIEDAKRNAVECIADVMLRRKGS